MNLNSITMPALSFSGHTSPLASIGTLNNDFTLYLLQKNIPTYNYLRSTNTFGVIIVCTGTLNVEINSIPYSLSQGDLAYLSPSVSFRLKSGNNEFKGYMMALSDFFVRSLQIPVEINNDRSFVNYYRQGLSDNIQSNINQIFSLIKDEISDSNRFFRREKLLNLVSIFYIDILNASAKSASASQIPCYTEETGRRTKLSKDFLGLVKLYSHEQRQVKFYANKLCITPKYLSLLIKQTTGKSANEWINNAVIIEAKYLLRTSGNSVKEVSFKLNFANQSFFGKYFKKIVGISPRDYQRNVEF
ncbi:helix-turn-helix domain-containing protein [uncultured Bacteroides sp.]|uniref:helix-turn-helix domain-containing protein n=1 Tax=uncultured Bacteroides sp. TaxID=162156 RepID=UPI002AAA970C|nr:helix-turn-helix domain-containing protein [uncultured Bacteroides sp.]